MISIWYRYDIDMKSISYWYDVDIISIPYRYDIDINITSIWYRYLIDMISDTVKLTVQYTCGGLWVLGSTHIPRAGASACGGLWRRKTCDRRVAAGFGNVIREIYNTQGWCKRLRWSVRFAGERDAGMRVVKVNLTFSPLAKLHPAEAATHWGM